MFNIRNCYAGIDNLWLNLASSYKSLWIVDRGLACPVNVLSSVSTLAIRRKHPN